MLRGNIPLLRGASAEIDLSALVFNLRTIKSLTKSSVIAVVKADAYGHGAVEVSKALVEEGVYALAVAFKEEALALRDSGIRAPIIVLFDDSGVDDFFRYGLIPVIHNLKSARLFSQEAGKRNTAIAVHIKADTGMGRMGFDSTKDILTACNLPNLKIHGLMSHFADADNPASPYTAMQLARFIEIKNALKKIGLNPVCHVANSAAIVNFSQSHLDAVRPGLMLFGWSSPPFKPVMKATAKVLAIKRLKKGSSVGYGRAFIAAKETLIAVLGIGYADGYLRALSNNSCVILKGKRVPVIGKICMDLTMVDATGIEDLKEQDTAVLIGKEGKEAVSAWELARWASTVPYEIMTSIGSKANRIYRK